jgi:predicted metal-dependent enzyme (double-stranded beta helix superfamily)
MTATVTPVISTPEINRPGVSAPDLGPAGLAARAKLLADHPEDWLDRVRLSPDGRWYERIHADGDHEVWVISWLPGQATGLHDHGGSSGAFAVALGVLEERDIASARTVTAGEVRQFGPGHLHDVGNASAAPAVSVHVYAPPLVTMRRYDLDDDGHVVESATETEVDW